MMGDAAVTRRIKTYPIIEKLKQEWVIDSRTSAVLPKQVFPKQVLQLTQQPDLCPLPTVLTELTAVFRK